MFIFNRHGKSFLILGSDDSNSNALRIGQTTALIFIDDRTLICCMIIYLYSTIYCFDSLALALASLASLASLSCFQHRVVLTTCRVGEGAYLLITHSFFLYVCIKPSVGCVPLSRICGVFFDVVFVCVCAAFVVGVKQPRAFSSSKQYLKKSFTDSINSVVCIFRCCNQQHPTIIQILREIFFKKNISCCVYLVKNFVINLDVYLIKNEQKYSKKFNSNLLFGKS